VSNPYLMFFPYLPLKGSYALGHWQIVPASTYSGPWASTPFEELSRTFLGAFRDATEQPFREAHLLVHESRGADGKLPRPATITAIQSAVNFATLDSHPDPNSDNAGWGTPTTDNSEVFIWPIDVVDGRVSLGRGSIVPVIAGGFRITSSLTVPAPQELQMPFGVALDQELLAAFYQLGTRRFSGDDALTRGRLVVAADWLAQAWRNSPSIRPPHRIVFLKTGFEALTDTSDSWQSAKRLRRLFETALAGESDLGVANFLWSPKETERHTVRVKQHDHQATDLQDWFMAFSKVRNTIIHDGLTPKLIYRKRGSSYNGNMIMTAERLLRESIKVSMGGLGYPHLGRTPLARAIHRAFPPGEDS